MLQTDACLIISETCFAIRKAVEPFNMICEQSKNLARDVLATSTIKCPNDLFRICKSQF